MQTVTIEQWRNQFPIRQSSTNGKYGFGRYADGFNLDTAVYSTREAAEAARDKAWEREMRSRDLINAGRIAEAIDLEQ